MTSIYMARSGKHAVREIADQVCNDVRGAKLTMPSIYVARSGKYAVREIADQVCNDE